jgi:ERCC4-related helicase
MPLPQIIHVPEQGQLIQLRHRSWLVQDIIVDTQTSPDTGISHKVILECLDDDQIGQSLHVIWEHEVSPQVYQGQGLPQLVEWDSPNFLNSLLTSVNWSSSSALERIAVQSPFYAAIDIEEYQLEPVVRALSIPRVNLLIADDVGLGKTIEAGLVIQELLSRRRIRRIMVVCPASLQHQWQDEMREKFRLDFQIIDRNSIQRLRREFGMHVNPWSSYPRLITSMDFLKREQPLRLFRESLQQHDSPLRDWDLLVVDEAHNVAPSGRSSYAIDSDRTRMMRAIADHFEHRLFLTATPHNGFTESFTALLELLDPLRFSRGPIIDSAQVQTIMIRRLKDDIKTALGHRQFAERSIQALPVGLCLEETEIYQLLDTYTQSRLERLEWAESMPVRFALTMLKKRLLSCPRAFRHSLNTHMKTLGAPDEVGPDKMLLERMTQRVNEDWADDEEKELAEDDALIESSRFFTDLTPEERNYLQSMDKMIDNLEKDTKLDTLLEWIDTHLCPSGEWNDERLVLFTEYKHTLDYLNEQLGKRYGEDRLLSLYGGMTMTDREVIKEAFQAHPSEYPVRILVATDAASEGLNLQNHCRYLVHYEIPWNPNRMEQRNGRIDRHGQKAESVTIYHFLFDDNADSRFLQTVIDKVQTIRADLGSVGDVIAAQVEKAMLGGKKPLALPEERRALAQDVVRGEVLTESRVRDIRRQMDRAREDLSINPETMAMVLDSALRLLNHDGLQPATDPDLEGKAYRLRSLPPGWKTSEKTLKDTHGRWRDITFDHDIARDRRDLTLLHLNHPLMRQAIGTFRARVWSDGDESGLNRVSYRVVRDLSVPVVLAYGRLVAVGSLSQRLHESVVCVGGEIEGDTIYQLSQEDIKRLLEHQYEFPPIPKPLGDDLRRLFRSHERQLIKMLETEEKTQTELLSDLAAQRADKDASAIQQLIDERIKELRSRIRKETKDTKPEYQLELFDRDEYLQYQEDMKWLQQKLTQLQERKKIEPDRIRQGYQLKTVRIFPLAVLYLLPENMLNEGGR